MVIDAAVDGQGIALARTTLAAWDLINGRLVRPFTEVAAVQDLLDHLPQGDGDAAEDRDVSRLAVGRSRARRPALAKTRIEALARLTRADGTQSVAALPEIILP